MRCTVPTIKQLRRTNLFSILPFNSAEKTREYLSRYHTNAERRWSWFSTSPYPLLSSSFLPSSSSPVCSSLLDDPSRCIPLPFIPSILPVAARCSSTSFLIKCPKNSICLFLMAAKALFLPLLFLVPPHWPHALSSILSSSFLETPFLLLTLLSANFFAVFQHSPL